MHAYRNHEEEKENGEVNFYSKQQVSAEWWKIINTPSENKYLKKLTTGAHTTCSEQSTNGKLIHESK